MQDKNWANISKVCRANAISQLGIYRLIYWSLAPRFNVTLAQSITLLKMGLPIHIVWQAKGGSGTYLITCERYGRFNVNMIGSYTNWSG